MSITSRITIIVLLLCGLLAGASIAPAHGDEEEGTGDDAANVLTFYTHPTERYNVLIPPGWQNVVNSSYALVKNDAIGAQIYGTSAATGSVDDASAQALALAELAQDAAALGAEAEPLTFGPWTQRAYTFDDGTTATAFVQSSAGQSYVLLYVSSNGVQPLIVRTETAVADEASARAALTHALDALGYADATIESMSADNEANDSFSAALTIDGQAYSAALHRGSLTTADVLIAPGDSIDPAHEAIFTVVRDFFLTPDSGSYLLLGLAVVFGFIALFVLSLVVRRRNLQRDEAALRTLEQAGDG